MSIPADAQCIQCWLDRNMAIARKLGSEAQATVFLKEMMKLFLELPEGASALWCSPQIARLLHEIYGLDQDRFKQEKIDSNAFVMARLDAIRASVEGAADPILAGLQHAILGNYIDFSALQGEVSFEQLDDMLRSAHNMVLDADCYAALQADLAAGQRLLYISDNAGEIGFDRIFAEQIHRVYPHLQITFLVRGGPANNDALAEDAAAVGLPFPVIGNGNCIPGTELEQLSPEAREALEQADVIISKGQANVETLLGCGHNIYYAFLVKCPKFIRLFGQLKLTPMLVKERNI